MEVGGLNNDMGKFKKFADYVRQRVDEDVTSIPAPNARMQKATAQAAAKTLKSNPVDLTQAKTNPQDLNDLRAKTLMNAAKNPSLTAIPNVTDIDATIGVQQQQQPSMMRKRMRR